MLIYKLDRKQTTDCISLYANLERIARKECKLIIDETYYIERYVGCDHIFYVHIKDRGRTIDKICVYQKEEGN